MCLLLLLTVLIFCFVSFDLPTLREALRKQMSMRGFIHDRLKASHEHHVEAVDEITNRYSAS